MTQRTIFTLLAVTLAGFAQDVNPKGIFVTPGDSQNAHPAVKYSIRLNRNGEVKPVAASYHFQNGDRFQFQFEMNRSSYVYLLLRTVNGDPDSLERYTGSKGITVVRDEDNRGGRSTSDYQLLWPAGGNNVRLSAHEVQSVPLKGQYFQFDSHPGLEKIVMIVSPHPVDVEKKFPGASGAHNGTSGGKDDRDEDVLGQLKKELDAMDRNTASTDTGTKGVCVGDCASYSAPHNPSEPFLVSIDLRHFR